MQVYHKLFIFELLYWRDEHKSKAYSDWFVIAVYLISLMLIHLDANFARVFVHV